MSKERGIELTQLVSGRRWRLSGNCEIRLHRVDNGPSRRPKRGLADMDRHFQFA